MAYHSVRGVCDLRVTALGGLLALSAIACSTAKPTDASRTSDAGPAPSAGSGGAGAPNMPVDHGPTRRADAAAGDYQVTASATRNALCIGQCTTLSAQAAGGVAPYRYRWDNDVVEGDAHEVCPQQTTTYTVTAHDASTDDGEFATKNEDVSDSVQITVSATCDDAGLPPATGGDPMQVCELRWPYGVESGVSHGDNWDSGSTIAADAHGNVVVAGAFWGTIDFGTGPITAVGRPDAFVIKLGPACEVLWLKTFGGAMSEVTLNSVAIDGNDAVVVGGMLNGSASFGSKTWSTLPMTNAALLFKLDADGEVLWSELFQSNNHGFIFDLGVDAERSIVISGQAAADTSFGGPALGGLDGSTQLFIAKLNADGEHLWTRRVVSGDYYAVIAVHPSGLIAAAGWSDGNPVDFGDGSALLDEPSSYLAELDGDGHFKWGHGVDPFERHLSGAGILWGGAVVMDANAEIVLDVGDAYTDPQGGWATAFAGTTRYDGNGVELWHRNYGNTGREMQMEYFGFAGDLVIDSQGGVIKSQDYAGEVEIAGVALSSVGASDVFVQKTDGDGNPIWLISKGGAYRDWTWGLAAAANDAIWLGYATASNDIGNEGEAVLVKLQP